MQEWMHQLGWKKRWFRLLYNRPHTMPVHTVPESVPLSLKIPYGCCLSPVLLYTDPAAGNIPFHLLRYRKYQRTAPAAPDCRYKDRHRSRSDHPRSSFRPAGEYRTDPGSVKYWYNTSHTGSWYQGNQNSSPDPEIPVRTTGFFCRASLCPYPATGNTLFHTRYRHAG